MKKLALLVLMSCTQMAMASEETLHYGVGLGSSYSGLGANVSLNTETDKKYLSAGCVSFGSYSGATCGVGVGWITTDILDASDNKHGLGLYLGVIDSKYGEKERYLERVNQGKYKYDKKGVYGVAAGYHYFFNGIDQSGAHLGLSATYGSRDRGESNTGLMLELGYQF